MKLTHTNAILISSLGLFSMAHAQSDTPSTTQPVSTLPEVVVTSEAEAGSTNVITQHLEQIRETYAGSVTAVDPDEMRLQKPSNVGDVVARVPGAVYVDEDGRGTKPNVAIRGLNPIRSEFTQLLLDGVPIQPSLYSEQAAYYGVPAERIAAMEVYKGGSAVLFGPNTVGGVVNFISRPLALSPFEGVLDTRFDSYGDYSGNLFLSGSLEKFSYGVEYLHKGGDGFRDSLGYNIHDADVRVAYQFNDAHWAQLHLHYYDETSETPGGLLPEQFRKDREQSNKPYDEFFGKRIAVDLKTRHEIDPQQRLETNTYFFFLERDWFIQNFVSDSTTDLTLADNNGQFLREFRVFGFEPKYTLDYDLGSSSGHQLTLGGRVYYDSVDRQAATGKRGTSREGDSILTSDEDLTTLALALYAQNEFQITRRLSIIPGLRFEHIEQSREDVLAGTSRESSTYDVWVPGVGLLYELARDTQLYANVTRSFRPPTFGDTFNPATGASNFDLEASTAWTYEAGIRANPYPWLLADLGGFYTRFKDQVIVSAGTASNFDTKTYGFEGVAEVGLLGLGHALRTGEKDYDGAHEVSLRAGATLVQAEFLDGAFEGNDLPYIPHQSLSFGIRYDYRDQFSLLFQGRYSGDRYTDNANTVEENEIGTIGQLEAYTVFDVKARWKVSEHVSLNAGVNNLFDESYGTQRRTGSQKGIFPGPTRVFYISSTITF
jgi:Fe(3+) dicitrate transport protein